MELLRIFGDQFINDFIIILALGLYYVWPSF